MSERIRPKDFYAAGGLDDWRVLNDGASASFRTGSFRAAVRLVGAIGELDAVEGHAPDVDLRPGGVTVRLVTIEDDHRGLTDRDVELARAISGVARSLGATPDPTSVQSVQVTIDALARAEVAPFWRAVLGYRDREGGDGTELLDPRGRTPAFWFQQMDAPRPQRNRIHVDVWVPHDQAQARIAAAIAAGGHLVTDRFAPRWWTLADAEGNEADVCAFSP